VTDVLVAVVVAIPVACAMEPWARLLHGRVWHARLWGVHRSHHTERRGRFEANDVLSAVHAPIAAALIVIGCQLVPGAFGAALIGVGSGMTLFGLAYVMVHDGLVHRRLPVSFLGKIPYFKRIRRAHLVHHARGGPPYGLFRGPEELTRTSPSPRGEPSAPSSSAPATKGRRGRPRAASTPSAGGRS
jgi:beta-carotene 3-hydroxylase